MNLFFRLCIRNLPPSLDDRGLRTLVAKHVPKEARIREARVMRDMARLQNGIGASKEFGFVAFVEHEHALLALRSLNNNPQVFGPDRRPIVDFSIENRKALLARQQREEKSRTNNPNFKGEKKSDLLASYKNTNGKKAAAAAAVREEGGKPGFAGTTADPKVKTLPKHTGEKIRHNRGAGSKISRKDLRKQEQDRKNPQKRKLAAEERREERQQKAAADPPAKKQKVKQQSKKLSGEDRRDHKENKEFDLLVNKYRNQFATNQTVVKKWFDT